MPYTPEEQKQRKLQMFGCDLDAFVESVDTSLTLKACGPSMVIISILSDAQEEIAMGDTERARQTINRAKFLVDRFLSKDTGE
jgi:hypothetical protein